jgi:hypothetical protein
MAVLWGTSLIYGCDCATPNFRDARRHADIIFRGKITGFRSTAKGYRVAILTVDRVWKGHVSMTFEMPALEESVACLGFWPNFLKIGNNLLVYAYTLPGSSDCVTDICSRTILAEESKDFAELGAGRSPNSK